MEHSKLEEKIGEGKGKPGVHKRQVLVLTLVLLVAGIGIAIAGINSLNKISADTTIANPPKPSDPTGVVANPPSPETPARARTDETGQFVFDPGWSMVSGLGLYGRDLSTLKSSGVILYSFNDVMFPNRSWTPYPAADSTTQSFNPMIPYGYYVYNPGKEAVTLNLPVSSSVAATASSNLVDARGWHLLYLPDAATTKDALLQKIQLTYSDGTVKTAAEAITSSEHKMSSQVYAVVDEHNLTLASATKLLGSATDSTTISQIPEKSFFWIYLRRTKDRVVSISLSAQTITDVDKKLINDWLAKNNLDNCGDVKTVAAATSTTATPPTPAEPTNCRFSTLTTPSQEMYEFLVQKFPGRPWEI